MRKFIIAAGLAAYTVAASGQQVLQCANPDVLNSLVFNARPEAKLLVKRTMPEIEAGFRAPAAFTLIGSGVRGQNASTVVAYKTTQETRAAFDSLLAFLSEDGWKRETITQSLPPGVSVTAPAPTAARLCRNGERRNMLVQEIEGVRYATIYGFETIPPRDCNVSQPQMNFANPMAAINALRSGMPQFSLPDSARTGETPMAGDHSSSSTVSASMRIDSPDTAASLSRHLARQLVQQGWRSDAEWNGALSSGSTWTRRTQDGQPRWGTLEILQVGAGSYDIGFTLAAPPL